MRRWWNPALNLICSLTCQVVRMPVNPLLLAAVPGLVSGITGLASTLFRNKSERREARRMNAYNSPKAQMERYREAGLSPYLIYGQGTPGNMSSPIPAQETGIEHFGDLGETPGRYMNIRQGNLQYDNDRLQNQILRYELHNQRYNQNMLVNESDISDYKRQRVAAEFYADFPEYIKQLDYAVTPEMVSSSYRMKMNELKRAAAQASVDRLRLMIQNQGFKNTVDRVKAMYASDYGMVGGDWTQGLGLVKTLGSGLFRGARNIPSMVRRAKGYTSMPASKRVPMNY